MFSVVFWSAPFCKHKVTQARLNDAQYLRKMKRYICKNKRLRRLTAMQEQAKKTKMCSDH